MARHTSPLGLAQGLWLLVAFQAPFTAPAAAAAPDLEAFRQLVALSDTPLADLVVDRAVFAPDGVTLVAGGWTRWPSQPCVTVFSAGRLPVSLKSAAPRFALAPDGAEIAYWVATSENWAQLRRRSLTTGAEVGVGEPRRANAAMQLAWTDARTLVFLEELDERCRAWQVDATSGAVRLLLDIQDGQWTALHSPAAGPPVGVWQGDTMRCFTFQAGGAPPREGGPELDSIQAPGAATAFHFDEDGVLWLTDAPERRKPLRVSDEAGAAAWSADGAVLMCARRTSLAALWLGTYEWRVVRGTALEQAGPEASPPLGLTWSSDGARLAYWQQMGDRGVLRRVDLGQERITVRVMFPVAFSLQPGDRLWLARDFLREKRTGAVIKPDWKTLKAECRVRSVQLSAPGMVVEAESVGVQSGTLQRITASLGEPANPSLGVPVELTPRPGIEAWARGATGTGRLLSVGVRVAPLGGAQ